CHASGEPMGLVYNGIVDTAASSGSGNAAASRPHRRSNKSVIVLGLLIALLLFVGWGWFWMRTGSRLPVYFLRDVARGVDTISGQRRIDVRSAGASPR